MQEKTMWKRLEKRHCAREMERRGERERYVHYSKYITRVQPMCVCVCVVA